MLKPFKVFPFMYFSFVLVVIKSAIERRIKLILLQSHIMLQHALKLLNKQQTFAISGNFIMSSLPVSVTPLLQHAHAPLIICNFVG